MNLSQLRYHSAMSLYMEYSHVLASVLNEFSPVFTCSVMDTEDSYDKTPQLI